MFRYCYQWIRKITWSDVGPIIDQGWKRPLRAEDLPPLPELYRPRSMVEGFSQLDLRGPWPFLWSVVRALRGHGWKMVAYVAALAAFGILGPGLIHQLIQQVEATISGQASVWLGLSMALALCIVNVTRGVLVQHYIFYGATSELLAINGLNMRLYQHALQLTRTAKQHTPVGDVVNYMGTDSDAVSEFMWVAVELVYIVIVTTGVTAMMFYLLGPAAFAAVVTLAVLSPLTKWIAKRFTTLDERLMDRRDERVSYLSQVLSGIRVVKFFAWEEKIQQALGSIRRQEVGARRQLALAGGASLFVYVSTTTLVGLATFGCHLYLGGTLDAASVFSVIALITLLEHPFGNLSEFIAAVAAGKVSSQRIIDFLRLPTRQDESAPQGTATDRVGLEFSNVTARYDDEDVDRPNLRDLSFVVQPGESVAIVGPIGAGKTTLLRLLLGDLTIDGGKMTGWDRYCDGVAYVPQQAFLLNASLVDNIRFGRSAVEVDRPLHAAGLREDLQQWPAGLGTEIGEHGINLSGGQKQRLSLARALASGRRLLLLDDPLSAVDPQTESWLVDEYIFGAAQERTRLVVTHRLEHLARFDRVLFLEAGRVVDHAPFAELLARCDRFRRFHAEAVASSWDEKRSGPSNQESAAALSHSQKGQASSARITADEDREEGAVHYSVYWDYLRAMAGETLGQRRVLLPLLALSVIAVAAIPILQNGWLAAWTQSESDSWSLGSWFRPWLGDDVANLKIFGWLGLLVVLGYVGQHLFWRLRAVAAGRLFHDRAIRRVMDSPVSFFDRNPVGRILNRFSKDLDTVDRELPWAIEQTAIASIHTLVAAAVMVMVIPWMALVVLPVIVLFYLLQERYRASGREVKRLYAITKSPRFAHFKETLEGLDVIRSYGQSQAFADRFEKILEEHQRMFMGMILVNRWFSVRMPLLTSFVSLAAASGVILLAKAGTLGAGTAGFVLMYSLQFWEGLNWAIRSFSEVEARMTAVERLKRYGELETERPVTQSPALDKGATWPARGEVQFDQVWGPVWVTSAMGPT